MYRKWKQMPNIANAPRDKQGRKKISYNTYVDLVVKDEEVKDWLDRFERQKETWKWVRDKYNLTPDMFEDFKLLDCGAGDGLFVDWLKKNGYDAIGMDINEKYVEYAKGKGRPVEHGDICHLPCPDNKFDVTFSHQVLGLVQDRKTAIRERLRVTKIGGLLIALDHLQLDSQKHFQAMNKYQYALLIDGIPDIEILEFEYSFKGTAKNTVLMVLRKEA